MPTSLIPLGSIVSAIVYACSALCISIHAFQPLITTVHLGKRNRMDYVDRAHCNMRIRKTLFNSRRSYVAQLHETVENTEQQSSSSISESKIIHLSSSEGIDFQTLMIMDVVLFQRRNNNDPSKLELGAVQENGNIAPLSTWTLESAYESSTTDMMEFVVDEEDLFPGLTSEEVTILEVLDDINYGSRQVGGGKGPGNPHGEESELLYYVDRSLVEGEYCFVDGSEEGNYDRGKMTIDIVVNTNLEHLW